MRGRILGRTGLFALSLVMAVVGVIGWGIALLGGADSPANSAVVDKVATATVQTQVAGDLAAVLSYDYTDPTSMSAAADKVLTGRARAQYATLFRTLAARAEHQRLILNARVSATSVVDLTRTHATLLVFVDQSSQRASDKQASVSAAQLSVQATKIGDHWLISSLKPL
jgi:Mce-associated membrane protein